MSDDEIYDVSDDEMSDVSDDEMSDVSDDEMSDDIKLLYILKIIPKRFITQEMCDSCYQVKVQLCLEYIP